MLVRSNIKLLLVLLALLTVIALIFFALPAIPQDLSYHNFADQRMLLGIPNMWDVISNLPFVVIALWAGLQLKAMPATVIDQVGRAALVAFYLGFAFTGLGSAYYHLNPTNATLVWDRLPMSIAFMSFFAIILNLHLGLRLGSRWLWSLLLIGAASVGYWAYSEAIGQGDLRPYGLVQFLPMLLIPLILWQLPQPAYQARYIWAVIGAYAGAKVLEHFDEQVFAMLGISGHSLKHVAASLAGVFLLYALKSLRRD